MSIQFDNLGDLKPKVTAGGKDKTKFVPNLNVSFFDDEFYFNLNRKDKVIKNEKAATASGKASLSGIDTDIWYIDDKGRFKWDIEFASRPAVNSWTWELKHTKGIEFYHQPALTAEEIADGCIRPEEVVGSYAVYCNKANNKYKTGKLCHIYRPFCYDANGNTIYANLHITDGQLTITIDTKWLDSAAYPVRLDPTFGYTSKGASSTGADALYLWGTRFTPPESGTAVSITAYVKSTDASFKWKYALYEYGTSTCSLLSGAAEGGGVIDDWSTLALSSSQAITSSEYVLALQGSVSTEALLFYYDSGEFSGQEGYAAHNYTDDWDSSESFTFNNRLRFSIYATYTESGGTGNSYYYQQQQM
jgi:hypothetical protein